jgi:hypothetical protein
MIKEISQNLEDIYIQTLEIQIIGYLAECLKIDNRAAMNIYYESKLCSQIHVGMYDIQYLDYKYLVNDLIENEINI